MQDKIHSSFSQLFYISLFLVKFEALPAMQNCVELDADFRMEFENRGFEVLEMRFLNEYLSATRNQQNICCCTFVSCVTAVEMAYRIAGLKVDRWDKDFFFDIQELYDNIFKAPGHEDSDSLKDVAGRNEGCSVIQIFDFAVQYGFLPSSSCTAPRVRNLLSKFNSKLKRYRISSYERLSKPEALQLAGIAPLVAELKWYRSLGDCRDIMYEGPNKLDIKKFDQREFHRVVVVGSVVLQRKNKIRRYLIAHNCHGKLFGYGGLVAIRCRKSEIFLDFYIPYVDQKSNRKRKRPLKL